MTGFFIHLSCANGLVMVDGGVELLNFNLLLVHVLDLRKKLK